MHEIQADLPEGESWAALAARLRRPVNVTNRLFHDLPTPAEGSSGGEHYCFKMAAVADGAVSPRQDGVEVIIQCSSLPPGSCGASPVLYDALVAHIMGELGGDWRRSSVNHDKDGNECSSGITECSFHIRSRNGRELPEEERDRLAHRVIRAAGDFLQDVETYPQAVKRAEEALGSRAARFLSHAWGAIGPANPRGF